MIQKVQAVNVMYHGRKVGTLFEDSLPGGYGEYLLRKVLKGLGVDPQTLNPVQWLSIVGSSGMGALCYVPETTLQHEEALLSLDEMQEIALENGERLHVATTSALLNEPISPPKMDY